MIAQLRGLVAARGANQVVLDCGGVGYELTCSLPALQRLPAPGGEVTLAVHTLLREDALLLFGFADSDERDLFRLLIGLNGVGPKIALALLSSYRPAELGGLVSAGDGAALTRVPGIGAKTAQRLLLELKDKLPRLAVGATPQARGGVWQDLESGLANLGYNAATASAVVDELRRATPEERDLTSLLTRALAQLRRP